MTELKPGDIVRMTKGEPDKPGFLEQIADHLKGQDDGE